MYNQVKQVQTKKLQNLLKKKEDEKRKKQLDEIESRARVIGNTVINLTDEPMSENEKLVLGYYGPNFNIAPKELPWKEFVSGFEAAANEIAKERTETSEGKANEFRKDM